MLLGLPDRLRLHATILEDGFDHEVAFCEQGVIGRRCDAGKQGIAISALGASAIDLACDELVRELLALVGSGLIAVDQHDVET